MPKNITVAIIGSLELFKSLGKVSTESDISLGSHFSQDGIFSYVFPKTYPEKLSSLIQSIALADTVVFVVGTVDATLGEQIVALDSFEGKRGFIVGKDIITDFIKGTKLEGWPDIPKEKVREELIRLNDIPLPGPTKVAIDHFFPVKGVGTVALGVVTRGKLLNHQKVTVEPLGKEVEIRSIHMHDKETQEAPTNARVGLALKGIDPEELSRGFLLVEKGSVKSGKEIKMEFRKSKFYKGEVREGEMFQMFFGTQSVSGRVKSLSPLVFEMEKLVAYEVNENVIVTKFDAKGLRVIGNGKIV